MSHAAGKEAEEKPVTGEGINH